MKALVLALLLQGENADPMATPTPPAQVAVVLEASFPETVDKAKVAKWLGDVLREAGCEQRVLEMIEPQKMRGWCRDGGPR